MPELVVLLVSPWSEKARWALDHHHVRYDLRPYSPIVGEPMLRVRMRKLRGKVTVPVLIDGARIFRDSLEIAESPSLM